MTFIVANILLPLLGTILSVIAGKAVQVLNAKYNLGIQEAAVKTGVAAAEKWAENYLKTENVKIPSSAKLDKAMAYINTVVPDATKADVQAKLQGMVEAEVLKLTGYKKDGNPNK
jgi:hypothetical protein